MRKFIRVNKLFQDFDRICGHKAEGKVQQRLGPAEAETLTIDRNVEFNQREFTARN